MRLCVSTTVCVSLREIYAQDVVFFPTRLTFVEVHLSFSGGFSTLVTVKDDLLFQYLSSHLQTMLHLFFSFVCSLITLIFLREKERKGKLSQIMIQTRLSIE